MAGKKRAAPFPIHNGNCTVEMEGSNIDCKSSEKAGAKIKIPLIKTRKDMIMSSCDALLSGLKSSHREGDMPFGDFSFLLVNPKDADSHSKSLIQEVLNIYMEELPTMNYAANTGKESNFLDRCVSSGKYRTLILRSEAIEGLEEVIAAVSYQIIPADTQCAEIPLAAVCSKYQNKGIGHLLYKELRDRLQNVGIVTIYCWADKESEGFWLKQGFISIGEVDGKGKARRLPVKADLRRALCFPGGSTLMVMHLKKDTVGPANSRKIRLCFSTNSHAKSRSSAPNRTPGDVETSAKDANRNISLNECLIIKNSQSQSSKNDGCLADALQIREYDGGSDGRHCSTSGETRRQVWEPSVSSLKTKRIRGGHLLDNCPDVYQDLACGPGREIDAVVGGSSLGTPCCHPSIEVTLQDRIGIDCVENDAQGDFPGIVGNSLVLKGECPMIMLMNITDDAKKTRLAKIIEQLGGLVTCNGSTATHVITGKARRTLNFCTALCSGAWVVSSNWLKASFKAGRFLDESEFILEEKDYLLKYKSELRDAVIRGKMNPCSLLRGYHVCLAKHIQPSVDVLSAIIKSAGGSVIRRLGCTEEPWQTIFLACEEDMGEALAAAKKGVRTFSSDWFTSCVMRQQLDLEAPQFTESL